MEFSHNDIEAFIEIARSGSITRAAENIGITQPSVSKALRRLEDAVGLPLIERGMRGARLTTEGQLFLESAKRFESRHFELVRMASELRSRHSGLLRVGVTSPASDSILVQSMSELIRRRPGMRLQLRIGKSDELNSAVEDGLLDLAVVPSYPEQTWSCAQTALSSEDVHIVARNNHPLAKLPTATLQDLTPYGWVMPSAQSAGARFLHQVFEYHGVSSLKVVLETEYVSEAVMGTIAQTDLLAMVPSAMLRSWIGVIVPLTIPQIRIQRTQVLLSRPQATWSPLMSDMRDLLLMHRPSSRP
ncbi:LysR family transcriptional regulator [Candidimonas humi]|jgi:molybdate transport repressor ModE-like protein|uniref:LysR family transcriptional regulator n=1 Tax=Candidimonas humi TaxID=683355 RepID=A0ABV8NTQ7_9BURK|nr:LysR family transcriptional regulator [Candidimonas humi]MBV6303333.1 LysR family transcriptional regulator [Candidimonas humi]